MVAREILPAPTWRQASMGSDHIVTHGSCSHKTGHIDCLRRRNGCCIGPAVASTVMADKWRIVSIVVAQNTEAMAEVGPRPASERAAVLGPDVIQAPGGRQFKFGYAPLHQYHRTSAKNKTVTGTSKGRSEIIDRDSLNANQSIVGIKGLSRSS